MNNTFDDVFQELEGRVALITDDVTGINFLIIPHIAELGNTVKDEYSLIIKHYNLESHINVTSDEEAAEINKRVFEKIYTTVSPGQLSNRFSQNKGYFYGRQLTFLYSPLYCVESYDENSPIYWGTRLKNKVKRENFKHFMPLKEYDYNKWYPNDPNENGLNTTPFSTSHREVTHPIHNKDLTESPANWDGRAESVNRNYIYLLPIKSDDPTKNLNTFPYNRGSINLHLTSKKDGKYHYETNGPRNDINLILGWTYHIDDRFKYNYIKATESAIPFSFAEVNGKYIFIKNGIPPMPKQPSKKTIEDTASDIMGIGTEDTFDLSAQPNSTGGGYGIVALRNSKKYDDFIAWMGDNINVSGKLTMTQLRNAVEKYLTPQPSTLNLDFDSKYNFRIKSIESINKDQWDAELKDRTTR